ncbi:COMM domain-containing protein, partial [Operophtera brumata]
MSQQLELLTENPFQWSAVAYVTPEIQKKEIKPFVVLALKELEGHPDSRTSSLVNADKFAALRAVVRHMARLRSASGGPFSPECCSELSALLSTDSMYAHIPAHLRVKPALTGLTWKIDLSLSPLADADRRTDAHVSALCTEVPRTKIRGRRSP